LLIPASLPSCILSYIAGICLLARRLIQRYNDIRTLCCHSKEREPTNDEVSELINGVDKSIKAIF